MRLDISKIPKGYYCYTWIEVPSEKNNFKGRTERCPFYKYKEISGVKVPWCDYLNLGGMDNNWTEEELKNIIFQKAKWIKNYLYFYYGMDVKNVGKMNNSYDI